MKEKYLQLLLELQKLHGNELWPFTFWGNKQRFSRNHQFMMDHVAGHKSVIELAPSFGVLLRTLKELSLLWVKFLLLKICRPVALKKNHSYVAVKTFLYQSSVKNDEFHDPFWADFTQQLSKSTDDLFIIVDPMNFPFKSFLSLKTKLPLYHFLSFLHFHDFLKAFLFIFKNYYREHAQHTQLSPALNQSIAQEFYHHEILLNYLHCQSYKNLITEFQISLIYSTFENNGWEKMLMKARNEAKAKTKVIAYQHVPIADSALNYDITTEDKNYLPDAIFTLGKATFERLKKSGYPSDILKLGCSIRTNLKVPTTAIPYQKIKRILIALDGMHQAAILPNYFAAYLLDLKKLGYETTFRFHPAFNLNQMKKFFTFPDQLVEAIKVSTQSLDQDLGDADLIVYYGSTVAFEGLARGKRVVHLYSPQEMLLNDPIEVHGGLHFRLSDQEPFLSYLEKLNSMSEAEFMQKQETSRAYVANYFIPYSTDKIQSILPQQILGK